MEFEKVLFKVHEFVLSRDCCKNCLSFGFCCSLLLLIFQLPFFLYGNYFFVGTGACLEPIISTQYILDFDSSIDPTNQTLAVIKPQDVVDIRIREPALEMNSMRGEQYNYAHYQFSGEDFIISLDEKTKMAHNFTYHRIVLDIDCFATTLPGKFIIVEILSIETILINEILTSMKGFDIHLRNMRTVHTFKFMNSEIEGIINFSDSPFWMILVLCNLLKILFGLFLVYTITALYIRIFFIYIPIWFFIGTARDTGLQRLITRQYSWLGIYYHTLQNNNKNTIWMFLALFMFQHLFGRLSTAVEVYWNFLLFDKAFPKAVSTELYNLIFWSEIFTILFVRTRTSLKYIPRFCILILVMFMYYFQHTVFAFYDLGIGMVRNCIFILFTYFLLTFEVKALQWNPGHHYTPSEVSPRTLYLPVFSTTWLYDLPPIWTMFYPLFGRSHFSTRELALVNGNYELVRQTIEDAALLGGNLSQGLLNDIEAPPNQIQIEMPQMDNGINENNISQQDLLQNTQ